jgi:hypothetical protein
MLNEAHMGEHRRGMALRVLIGRMRHEGCGGSAGTAELLIGIDGVSSRPVRKIVLMGLNAAKAPKPKGPRGLGVCHRRSPHLPDGG